MSAMKRLYLFISKKKLLVLQSRFTLGRLTPAVLVIFAVTGCGGGGDDGGGGSSTSSVTSSANAQFMVRQLAGGIIGRDIRPKLSNNTYSSFVINGLSGTATVSGTVSYTTGSCGGSCVNSINSTNLSITFVNYAAMSSGNVKTTLTGTMSYSDYTYSQQSGLIYTSGGLQTVSSTSTAGVTMNSAETSGQFVYNDTITFNASNNSLDYVTGWAKGAQGTTYYF